MRVNRYNRQSLFVPLGEEGQARLRAAGVVVVGCGALGTNIANLMVRSGVGRIRIIDRDLVDWTNLHRQVLFTESDASQALPKAEAAAARLAATNSEVEVEANVIDLTARNAEELLAGADVILDGTDNVETRYLINDVAVKHGKPWVYGGAVGSTAVAALFTPGGACLRCLWGEPPPPGSLPTCDTAGVLPSAPAVAAALQVSAATRYLATGESQPHLLQVDVWDMQPARLRVRRRENCRTCGQGNYEFLSARSTSWTTNLCGRNAVQVSPPEPIALDADELMRRWRPLGSVRRRGLYIEFDVEDGSLLVFPDGRVIVKNTTDPARARTLVSRYLGY